MNCMHTCDTDHAKMLLIGKSISHPKRNRTGTQWRAYHRLAVGCNKAVCKSTGMEKVYFLGLFSGFPANVHLFTCNPKHKLVCMTKQGSLPTPVLQGCQPSWKLGQGLSAAAGFQLLTGDSRNQHLGPVQLQGGEAELPSMLRQSHISEWPKKWPIAGSKGSVESHHYT